MDVYLKKDFIKKLKAEKEGIVVGSTLDFA